MGNKMEDLKKMTYAKPEVVEFQWMQSMGDCNPTGSGDLTVCQVGNTAQPDCFSNGNNATGYCIANGSAV